MLPIAAATATVRSVTTRSCWRHSRRNSATAQRVTARRAATPPFRGPASADGCATALIADRRREQRLGAGRRDRLVDDAAVAEEDDAVGPGRELGVVGDDDAGDAALAGRPQQAHDRLAVDRVEGAGRLVGEQQPAVADDRPGDRDPLALAARQLVRVAVGARRPRRAPPAPAGRRPCGLARGRRRARAAARRSRRPSARRAG